MNSTPNSPDAAMEQALVDTLECEGFAARADVARRLITSRDEARKQLAVAAANLDRIEALLAIRTRSVSLDELRTAIKAPNGAPIAQGEA